MIALLEDQYLSGFFWQEPSVKRAGQAKRAAFNAQTWYIEERWTMILDEILARVYLMRCQLVHGAATYGGKLNRTSLKRCVMMMQRLLPALLWCGLTTVPMRIGGRCAIRRWTNCRDRRWKVRHRRALAGREDPGRKGNHVEAKNDRPVPQDVGDHGGNVHATSPQSRWPSFFGGCPRRLVLCQRRLERMRRT